jgi:hypothetical protein
MGCPCVHAQETLGQPGHGRRQARVRHVIANMWLGHWGDTFALTINSHLDVSLSHDLKEH